MISQLSLARIASYLQNTHEGRKPITPSAEGFAWRPASVLPSEPVRPVPPGSAPVSIAQCPFPKPSCLMACAKTICSGLTTSSGKSQPAAGTSQRGPWAFPSLPGKTKEEASSEPAPSTTELTQQQQPCCGVCQARGFARAFLHPPAHFKPVCHSTSSFLSWSRVQSSNAGSCNPAQQLYLAAYKHKPSKKKTSRRRAKSPPKPLPTAAHGSWLVKSAAERGLCRQNSDLHHQVRDLC